MKNQELFNKTVSILVNAYQNDTLRHGSCAACAVGNLILASNGSCPQVNRYGEFEWDFSIPYSFKGISWFSVAVTGKSPNALIDVINKTGYSWAELSVIEKSFEGVDFSINKDKYMFDGLMAVVDTLMIIHEANETQTQEAKSLFVKETA